MASGKRLKPQTREVVDRLAGREPMYDLEIEANGMTQRINLNPYPRNKQQIHVQFKLIDRGSGFEIVDELALQLEIDLAGGERIILRNPHE